jgi:hypothetical protein
MFRIAKIAFALAAPVVLLGCLLVPGKFVSTMTINADRSFAFTYKGEVIAINPSGTMGKGLGEDTSEATGDDKAKAKSAETHARAALAKAKAAKDDEDRKNRALAAMLSKEAGYRTVAYAGGGKFIIDYAVKGRLDHAFIFPYNSDAEVVFPFIAVELRRGGGVRLRAPGFAADANKAQSAGMGGLAGVGNDASKFLDGDFTLDTNADIVSQNSEEGAKTSSGRSVISWRATPLSKDAPTAVLRLAQ